MILINGVKITNADKQIEDLKKPSINEILDKMQVNYNNINFENNKSVNIEKHEEQKVNNNDNNLLLTLLPLLLNNKGDSAEILKTQQNELLHGLIKNLNNPLLEKIIDILPKLNKKPIKTEEKNEKPKIESYIKTDEYNSKN